MCFKKGTNDRHACRKWDPLGTIAHCNPLLQTTEVTCLTLKAIGGVNEGHSLTAKGTQFKLNPRNYHLQRYIVVTRDKLKPIFVNCAVDISGVNVETCFCNVAQQLPQTQVYKSEIKTVPLGSRCPCMGVYHFRSELDL